MIGFLLAVWTTTSAATALMEGIATAFGGTDERGFVRKRLVALVIVACLVVASLFLVGLLVLGPHLERWLGDATGQKSLVGWLWWTAQWPILIVVLLFAFAVVLALGPALDERPRIRVSAGSVVALAVWLAASGGLAVYSASLRLVREDLGHAVGRRRDAASGSGSAALRSCSERRSTPPPAPCASGAHRRSPSPRRRCGMTVP